MSKSYFVNQKSALWRSMWQALAIALSGGPVTQPLTNQEITVLVSGWGYEGSDQRGHCFTLRAPSGRKSYLFI